MFYFDSLVCSFLLLQSSKRFFYSDLNPRFVSDAEPKYLVAVQPIPVNDVKKHCTGTSASPCLVHAAARGDRMSHSVLACLHREGEPGEAAPPGDRLRQPDGGASVLGKLPEDALRREHHERVSGGRVRAAFGIHENRSRFVLSEL